MIDNAVTALGCSNGLAYSTMHDHLKSRKLCGRCVHREVKDREKINRMCLSLQLHLEYADERVDTPVLNRIVTGD
jgi:hypothetical protein